MADVVSVRLSWVQGLRSIKFSRKCNKCVVPMFCQMIYIMICSF